MGRLPARIAALVPLLREKEFYQAEEQRPISWPEYNDAQIKQATDLPILAQPNAGLPELIEGKTVFAMGPVEFAEGIAACVRAGARIVGGCCGTTPEHIRAVRQMLNTP